MTLHFDWFHAPHWLARVHVNRAMTLVVGVIGISLFFSALRVVDAAISGDLVARHAVAAAPSASGAVFAPDTVIGTDPTSAGTPVDDPVVQVPEATVEAFSL